jgi:UDP-glucose 4-epimerase
MSARNVAVVGATGFIGTALMSALMARGGSTGEPVWVPAAYSSAHPYPICPDVLPDAVIYLASTVNPAIAERDPGRAEQDIATLRDVITGLERAGADRLRFILPGSGGTVYDPAVAPPYDERSSTLPASRYGRAKLLMEQEVAAAAARGALDPVVLRLSNLYGPGQRIGTGQGVIINWLHAAATGREAVLFGDPSATRDYIHIGDAVRAILAALDATAPPPVLNIGAGQPTSLGELADTIERVVSTEFRIRRAPGRGFDVAHSHLTITAAARYLDWRPEVDLETGLALTWAGLVEDATGASSLPSLPPARS